MIAYTIGYAKLAPARLAMLAGALNLTVCDIRGKRMTRRPGYGPNQLEELLGRRYQWWGQPDLLAGKNHGGTPSNWPRAMTSLLATVERPLLMCACASPSGCHRHATAAAWAAEPFANLQPRGPFCVRVEDAITRGVGDSRLRHFVHLFDNPHDGEQEAITGDTIQAVLDRKVTSYDAFIWYKPEDLLARFES